MKELYDKAMAIWDDYRHFVPSFSSAALSFYLLVLLIPATSILAIIANGLNIDLSVLETLLTHYIQPSYSSMIIKVLKGTSINTVSILIFIWSIYAVSRGVGNIYDISKEMFKTRADDENIVEYYIYVFKVTVLLMLSMISIIVLLAVGPISKIFTALYEIALFRYIILYWIMVLFFMSIYMIVPKEKVTYREGFRGAVVAAGGLVILYIALSIYFRFADFKSLYGPLASIIVVLFVFDWASEIFYIGMYITHLEFLRRKEECVEKN